VSGSPSDSYSLLFTPSRRHSRESIFMQQFVATGAMVNSFGDTVSCYAISIYVARRRKFRAAIKDTQLTILTDYQIKGVAG
jgi:hypothetical protein